MENQKVKDLIAFLKTQNPDLLVSMEGCDCYQQWNGEGQVQGKTLLLLNYDNNIQRDPEPPQEPTDEMVARITAETEYALSKEAFVKREAAKRHAPTRPPTEDSQ